MKKLTVSVFVLILLLAQCRNEQSPEQKNETNSVLSTAKKNNKNIKLTASSENVVEAGEIFRIKFEANTEVDNFTPPDFEGLDVVSGPMTSSFSSIQIINGKQSKTITNSYSYSVSCSELGSLTVKPAEITVDGNAYKSNPLQIKIIGNNSDVRSKQKKQKNNTKEDIFLRTEFSKVNVYNGEFITATTKIYTKTDFQNISEIKFPDYSGFWSKTLKGPRQLIFHNELINGKKYSTALLKQILLFAVKPGKYTIMPYQISLQLKKKNGKVRDFFGNIVDNYKLINKRLKTDKQIIVVKPLPQPIPDNFSGFTGKNVSVKAETDIKTFKTDESVNYKVTISGTGNLYMLNNLKLELPEGLKYFKPEIELKDKYTENGETGDKIFNFIITSEKTGTFKIPKIEFIYFDSDAEKYKTVFSEPITITVTRGKGFTLNADNEKVLSNKDIRYIKDVNTKLKKEPFEFAGTRLFYLSYIFLFLLFLMLIYFINTYKKSNADIKTLRKKKAGKVSKKRLKTALKYMTENNQKAFYKEILNAIWGYLSDKMSVNADNLTQESIKEILLKRNVDEELADKILKIIEICGYAQYSPAGEEAKPEIIYKNTENLINELENIL